MLRLLIALILGAVVGLERERQERAAGLRTVTMVSLGSCRGVWGGGGVGDGARGGGRGAEGEVAAPGGEGGGATDMFCRGGVGGGRGAGGELIRGRRRRGGCRPSDRCASPIWALRSPI